MASAKQISHNEPVTIGGAILAFLVALGPALVAFGVDLSAEQLATAQGVAAALVVLVTIVVRGKVTPVHPEADTLDG